MNILVLFLLALLLLVVVIQSGGVVESFRRLQGYGPKLVIAAVAVVVVAATLYRSTAYMNDEREGWITRGQSEGDTVSRGFNTKSRFRSLSQPLGRVTDRNGKSLAGYELRDGHIARTYPAGSDMAHIIGYWTGPVRDGAGVEKALTLINDSLKDDLPHDVQLSIDLALQRAAQNALGGRAGAVVVLDPATGQVLAAASQPSYDPSRILENDYWRTIATDRKRKPLVSRAIKDNFSPGSSIKPLIAAAARATLTPLPEERGFVCTGTYKPGPGIPEISDHGSAHGRIDVNEAMRVSCNCYFSFLAYELLGYEQAKRYLDSLGFNDRLSWNTDAKLNNYSTLRPAESWVRARDEIAKSRLGIGQASVKVNPLHFAVLVGAIANEGVALRPTLQLGLEPDTLAWRMDSATAVWTAELMREPLQRGGTAVGAFGGFERRGITVYGKTGTADREPDGRKPAWFISFAEKNGRRMVVAVAIENRGGQYAGDLNAPIARKMYEALDGAGMFGEGRR